MSMIGRNASTGNGKPDTDDDPVRGVGPHVVDRRVARRVDVRVDRRVGEGSDPTFPGRHRAVRA